MANSKAIPSYRQERIALETAFRAGRAGIDLSFPTANAAKYFVSRCNSLRQLLRPTHEPEQGGPFDTLRISRSDCKVHIMRWDYVTLPTITDAETGEIMRPHDQQAIYEEIEAERHTRTEKTNKDFLLE
jgi:hypothetical protein